MLRKKLPTVLIVGGPDVDKRIDLMLLLKNKFQFAAVGSNLSIEKRFHLRGFSYYYYSLSKRANPFADIISFYELLRIFKELRPQVVHTFDTKPAVWGRLAAWKAGIPVIIGTIPGLGSLYTNSDLTTRIVRIFYQQLQKIACRVSSVTIFQNRVDADQFINKKIVPKDKVVIIPGSGVRMDIFSPDAVSISDVQNLRTELGIDDGTIVVTMISRLIRSKGVLEFASAAQDLGKHYDNVRFLLIGPYDVGNKDQLSVEDFSMVQKYVMWLGERTDIPAILKITDIFVLPTFYREGIPRVLMEAGAMEKPLIAADVPGSREVVINGYTGLLVKPRDSKALADAIVWMKNHPNERKVFGENARKLVEKRFDINIIAKQTAEIYERLINEFRGKR